ncbi:hypothetical protein VYU27_007713 [Nannochloropsis oceanica]
MVGTYPPPSIVGLLTLLLLPPSTIVHAFHPLLYHHGNYLTFPRATPLPATALNPLVSSLSPSFASPQLPTLPLLPLPTTLLPSVERVSEAGGKLRLRGMSLADITILLTYLNIGPNPEVKSAAVFKWLYHRDLMVHHSIFEALSSPANTAACCLSRQLCLALDAATTLEDGLKLIDIKHAKDGTKKLVMQITSGPAKGKAVESVLIPMVRGPQQAPRYTLCVSSQSGCAMDCAFC